MEAEGLNKLQVSIPEQMGNRAVRSFSCVRWKGWIEDERFLWAIWWVQQNSGFQQEGTGFKLGYEGSHTREAIDIIGKLVAIAIARVLLERVF